MSRSTNSNGRLESAIAKDVEFLRAAHKVEGSRSTVRSLVIPISSLLFFKYQQVPTANRVHALIGRGSMTTVAREMDRFWALVRNAAHSSFPDSLVGPLRSRKGSAALQREELSSIGKRLLELSQQTY